MTNKWPSPVDKARIPGNTFDRLDSLESLMKQVQQKPLQLGALQSASQDTWALSTSFPSICQGRLTLTTGVPVTNVLVHSNIVYFTPFIGNLIGMYNGSMWQQIPFEELQLPGKQSQTGSTHNGTAVIDGLTDTSQLVVGMIVSGAGIPVTASILTVDSATQITMNVNSTASASVTVTFYVLCNTNFDVFMVDIGNGQLALRMKLWDNGATNTGTITGVTNASPPVVTSAAHGLVTGELITTRNIGGAVTANGTFRVGTTAANTFQLLNTDATNPGAPGVYTSGGTWQRVQVVGTRVDAISLQDGIYVLTSDPTWRYLGTCRSDPQPNAVSVLLDGPSQRFVWNYYNRRLRILSSDISTVSWTVPVGATWYPLSNDIGAYIGFVIGVVEDEVAVRVYQGASMNATSTRVGVVFDGFTIVTTTPPVNYALGNQAAATVVIEHLVSEADIMQILGNTYVPGYHFAAGQNYSTSTTLGIFRGNGESYVRGHCWS